MPVSRKALIRRFKSLGFMGPYSGAKHHFMIKGRLKIRIPNPHKAQDISDPLLHEILRQAAISNDEWGNASSCKELSALSNIRHALCPMRIHPCRKNMRSEADPASEQVECAKNEDLTHVFSS